MSLTSLPPARENPLIGFAYPTHGFNAIPAMIYFMLRLPHGEGRKVFLMNTRGGLKLSKIFINGLSGMALLLPAFILLMKGFRCIGFRPVDLPSNWIILHPGVRREVVSSIYEHWEVNVRRFARKILSGKRVWRGLYSFPVDIAMVPLALGYYLAGQIFSVQNICCRYRMQSLRALHQGVPDEIYQTGRRTSLLEAYL